MEPYQVRFLGEPLGELASLPLFYWKGPLVSKTLAEFRAFCRNVDGAFVLAVNSVGGKSAVMADAIEKIWELQERGTTVVTVGFVEARSAASCLCSAGSLVLAHPRLRYGIHGGRDEEATRVQPRHAVVLHDLYHDLAERMGKEIQGDMARMVSRLDETFIWGRDLPGFGLAHEVVDAGEPLFAQLREMEGWR